MCAASCFIGGVDKIDAPASGGQGGTGGTVGGEGGVIGGEGGQPEVCESATYPEPPPTTSAAALPPIVMAFTSVNLGENSADDPTVGFNLDDRCSCDVEGPSCVEPTEACDGPGGRDNASSRIFAITQANLGLNSETITEAAVNGKWSLVLQLEGYNGELEDSQVTLTWYLTGTFQVDGLPGQPLMDGSDVWPISEASLNDPAMADINDAKYRDVNAYVTGGQLVASLPNAELRFAGSTSTIRIRFIGGIMVGTLEEVATVTTPRWTITQGTLGAIWPASEVFNSIASYRDDRGNAFCTNDGLTYNVAKSLFCGARDILENGTAAPSTPCDALSVGLEFTTFPANIGPIIPAVVEANACPAEFDPAMDTCD